MELFFGTYMNKTILFISVFFISSLAFGQQTLTKRVKSKAPYIDINTKGIDFLKIELSDSDEIVITVDDKNGLGILEKVTCNDYNCVLSIATEVNIKHPNTDKGNQLPIKPSTKVSAVVQIPKNKKVTVLGEEIDVYSKGYQGMLRILIESGKVDLQRILGITEVQLFTGNVFATIDDNSLDIKTRKGKLSLNDEVLKSTLKKKNNQNKKLIIRTIEANIFLNSSTQ